MSHHAPAALRRLIAPAVLATFAGCGGGPDVSDPKAADPCAIAAKQLAGQLGPELKGVTLRLPLTFVAAPDVEPAAPGCALIYEPVREEMPSELPMGETMDNSADHQLAIALPDPTGRIVLSLIDPSAASPGPVRLTPTLRDVDADGQPDLVVEEIAGDFDATYKGVRIYAYAPGSERAREIFAEQLLVTTVEGLKLIPTWKTGAYEGKRAVIFDGAGAFRLFLWDDGTRRFTFDEAATAAKNPKPAPPPAAAAAEGAPAAGGETAKPAEGEQKPMFDLP